MKFLRLGALFVLLLTATQLFAKEYTVGITQIVEHPALDACRQGIEDELKAQGFSENTKVLFESAQGNIATATQIAKKFIGADVDVAVAIATPSAQTLLKASRGTVPVVFSAVTDPVGAKLVNSLQNPGKSSGVSDLSPVGAHVALIQEIVPNVQSIGVVFNAGEANSVTLVNLLKKHAKDRKIQVVEAVATKSADVQLATQSLVGKVQAIYIPTDNMIVSALESVIRVADDAKIPVIAADTDSVKRGAAAALGFNYYNVGRQTGKVVADVLRGKKVGTIPVEQVKKLDLFVNIVAARKQGIVLPAKVVARAKEIIE